MQCLLNRNRYRWQFLLILWLGPVLTALALIGGLTSTALGVTGTKVTNTNDSGAGSLRQVILDAAAGSTIVFDSALFSAPQTITLNSELAVAKSLTIDGAAGGVVTPTISGPGAACGTCFRVFNITGADVTLKRLVIVNGKPAGGAGGGIFSSGNLTIADSIVADNASSSGGGVAINGFLTLMDSAIVSNTATGLGGGVYVYASAVVSGSLFQGNSGTNGGGLNLTGSLWTTSTQFLGNTATSNYGGGLSVNGELHMLETQFIDNVAAAGYGGGVYVDTAAYGKDVLFRANRGRNGGGMYAFGRADLTGVEFVSNTATTGSGGGLLALSSTALTNTDFLSNTAGGAGGGLSTSGATVLIDTNFLSNTAGSGGGGVYANGTAAITNTNFLSNTTSGSGGGLYANGTTVLTNSDFLSNTAANTTYGGGAVYLGSGAAASLLATNVDAFYNVARNGGAIYASKEATISGGRYVKNMSDGGILAGQGGALYARKAMTVTGAQIVGNYAYQGGGILQENGGLKVINTLLARNSSYNSGYALYLMNLSGAPAQIVNSTIVTPTVGPGIAIYSLNGTAYVTNTLFAGYATGIQKSGGFPEEDYNLFAQVTTQTAGITRGGHSRATSNARFVDPANDDYHLLTGSGAVGSGIDAGVTLDMDGTTRPNPPSIGAYEGTAQPGEYAFTNTADVTSEVPYKGVVTYTLVLTNNTALIDSNARVTDVLPTGATFKDWITKPVGAAQSGDTVRWSGSITDSTTLTLGFVVTNTASGGAVITNTAVFSGTDAASSAAAVYGATTAVCVATQTGGWSVAFATCILPDVKKVILPPISVTLDRSNLTLTGDLEVQTGGALIANSKTLTLTGGLAQTLSGDPLTFYNLVLDKTNKTDRITIGGKLKVTKKLLITKGSLVSASEYGDLEIQDEGVLTLTNPISITGSFTNSGDLYTEGFAVNFTGGLFQPAVQNLVLNVMTWFDDLNVLTGTTLVEAVTDDNAYLNGALTNYGTIRKTQPIAAAIDYNFGLAGTYVGSDLEVDAAVPGTLTSLQVDRFDAAPANPPVGKTTPIYWTITPVGSGYTVNLTLPHDGVSTPSACRRVGGSTWDCAQSASSTSTVTRNGVTQFSDWAVFSVPPLVPTTTTVTSHAGTSVFGEPVVFTATLDPVNVGGTVQFYAGGAALGSAQQIEGGTAVFTSSALAVGSYAISATSTITTPGYLNSEGTLTGLQVVNKANSTTTVNSSANPSLFGQGTTFTATVTVTTPGAGIPEGEVTFSADGDAIDDCEAVELNGAVAACTTALLAAGTHTVTAGYAGSANYLGSTSPAYYQVVQPLPVAVNDAGGTLQETPVTLTVLANDLDPAGGGLLISAITLQPVHGAVAVAPDDQTVLYTPETGFSGQDSFMYVATDANGSSDDALATIMVTAKSQTAEPPQIEPVNPEVDASKEFTSPAANVEVQLPANFYTDTLSEKEILFLSYTPVVTATEPTHTPPGNLKFGNFEFDLTLFRNNEPQHDVQFEAPLTVTIAYDPAMLDGLREDLLDVYFWNGTEWSKDGVIVLGHDLINHTVTFLLAHLSHFGFFSSAPTASDPAAEPAAAPRLYLPGVLCRQQAAGAAESLSTPAPAPDPIPEVEPPSPADATTPKIYLPLLNR